MDENDEPIEDVDSAIRSNAREKRRSTAGKGRSEKPEKRGRQRDSETASRPQNDLDQSEGNQNFVEECELALFVALAREDLGVLEVGDWELALVLHLVFERGPHGVVVDVVERGDDAQCDVVHDDFFDVRRDGDDGEAHDLLVDLDQELHEADDEGVEAQQVL